MGPELNCAHRASYQRSTAVPSADREPASRERRAQTDAALLGTAAPDGPSREQRGAMGTRTPAHFACGTGVWNRAHGRAGRWGSLFVDAVAVDAAPERARTILWTQVRAHALAIQWSDSLCLLAPGSNLGPSVSTGRTQYRPPPLPAGRSHNARPLLHWLIRTSWAAAAPVRADAPAGRAMMEGCNQPCVPRTTRPYVVARRHGLDSSGRGARMHMCHCSDEGADAREPEAASASNLCKRIWAKLLGGRVRHDAVGAPPRCTSAARHAAMSCALAFCGSTAYARRRAVRPAEKGEAGSQTQIGSRQLCEEVRNRQWCFCICSLSRRHDGDVGISRPARGRRCRCRRGRDAPTRPAPAELNRATCASNQWCAPHIV